MRRNSLVAFVILVLFSANCAGLAGTDGIFGAQSSVPTAIIQDCPAAALQPVALSIPVSWRIVDGLLPQLSWTYPASACTPQVYVLSLSTGPRFTDELGARIEPPLTLWTPSAPLQPGREYRWSVHALSGETDGPESEARFFYTGPLCGGDQLAPSELLDPADSATITQPRPNLIWRYPQNCTPQAYKVDLSTDPGFASNLLGGSTGYPSLHWVPAQPVSDCQTYYWRVTAVNVNASGPLSAVRSFKIDINGNCAATQAVGQGSISGSLWDDLCTLPAGATPPPLPIGCADDGSGGIRSDGFREVGEVGVPDVQVDLGEGQCPATGLATAMTNADGQYAFPLLSAGTYCVSIDGGMAPNDALLIPGRWTAPAGMDKPLAAITVVVADGQAVTQVQFGWDYQSVGAPLASDSTPGPPGSVADAKLTMAVNANCRSGPGWSYSVLTTVYSGQIFPLLGRSADSVWLDIQQSNERDCWVATTTGTSDVAVADLAELEAPPTPTVGVDRTPPQILNLTVNSNPVFYPKDDCGATLLIVSARIFDASPLDSVYVRYRYLGSGGHGRLVGDWTEVPMTIFEGKYSALIDVGGTAERTLNTTNGKIDFSVFAVDAAGNVGNAPDKGVKEVKVMKCTW